MSVIKGQCDEKFTVLKTLLKQNIASGAELGASIAVNIDGENVVDIWGGYTDEARTRLWEKDTIVNVWSITKMITTFAGLLCIERGLLDPYEKVSKYWPEFGVNGKEDIEVRHFMSHTSGLSGWEGGITLEETCDLETSTSRLATQAPWWTPGTASGYHFITMGHLIGELIRRVTGKPLKQFVAEEIAAPLQADVQIGALESDWRRVTDLIPPPPMSLSAMDPESVAAKSWSSPILDAEFGNHPSWRRAEIGAANGHANARSLNKVFSIIAQGGKSGRLSFLSPKTIDKIFEEQASGVDLVTGIPITFGIGYAIGGKNRPNDWIPQGRVCYWGGWGGSIVIMDLDRRITISYVMNKMGEAVIGSELTKHYIQSIYATINATQL